jgi:hypothetical protein
LTDSGVGHFWGTARWAANSRIYRDASRHRYVFGCFGESVRRFDGVDGEPIVKKGDIQRIVSSRAAGSIVPVRLVRSGVAMDVATQL